MAMLGSGAHSHAYIQSVRTSLRNTASTTNITEQRTKSFLKIYVCVCLCMGMWWGQRVIPFLYHFHFTSL